MHRERKVQAKNGKNYYLVEVIAHILKYLKDELIKKLKKAEYALEATDFDWVITVPAIWRNRGKQMMREAGYKVNIIVIIFMLLLIILQLRTEGALLTFGAHAHSEGYSSCPVCVYVCMYVCVHSNLPSHTLKSQKRDTNGFIAIQE